MLARFEQELIQYMRDRHSGLLEEVRSTGGLDDDAMEGAVTAFAAQFEPTTTSADGEQE